MLLKHGESLIHAMGRKLRGHIERRNFETFYGVVIEPKRVVGGAEQSTTFAHHLFQALIELAAENDIAGEMARGARVEASDD